MLFVVLAMSTASWWTLGLTFFTRWTEPGTEKPAHVALAKELNLSPHPEGGYFLETYRSSTTVSTPAGPRSASTAILFLVTPENVSRMHRINSDEIWHFYRGSPLTVVEVQEDGSVRTTLLSQTNSQYVVRSGTWFGSYTSGPEYSLVGCTVAPGFDFADFELGSREALLAACPPEDSTSRELILRLTKGL